MGKSNYKTLTCEADLQIFETRKNLTSYKTEKIDQFQKVENHFGSTRFIYNRFLTQIDNAFKRELDKFIKKHSDVEITIDIKKVILNKVIHIFISELPHLKKEYPWLNESSASSLQEALKDLKHSYNLYLMGLNEKPKFRKKTITNVFSVTQDIKIEDNKIYIPKFKEGIRLIKYSDRMLKNIGEVVKVVISKKSRYKNLSHKQKKDPKNILYEVSIIYKSKSKPKYISSNDTTAVVIKEQHIIKTNKNTEDPKISKLQKILKRKKVGSNRYNKLINKINKLKNHMMNKQIDYLHKLTNILINKSHIDVAILVEDNYANHHSMYWHMFKKMVYGKQDNNRHFTYTIENGSTKYNNINSNKTRKNIYWSYISPYGVEGEYSSGGKVDLYLDQTSPMKLQIPNLLSFEY